MTFIFCSIQKQVNKFLASLSGTNLVLGGNVENLGDLHILVYTKISQQMHQFLIILKPIWSSHHVGKLRNGPRTWLSIDAQAAEPLWLHPTPPKRSASFFPSLILQSIL